MEASDNLYIAVCGRQQSGFTNLSRKHRSNASDVNSILMF